MATEKKALWVVFRPETLESTAEMRKKFLGSYPHFKEMDGLFSKCWWCNQEKGEWGALYIFNSDADLQAYITSERWLKVVPEKYGCKPEIQAILDPGPILCNAAVTEGEDSWMTASESSERR